jgi:hypothetical protein
MGRGAVTIRPLISQPNIHEHRGFMLAEDEALRSYLSGITVPGRDPDTPPIKVGCWFRWPESERQIKYPFITIDSISAEPAYELFHSDHQEPIEEDGYQLYWPDQARQLPPPSGGWALMAYSIRNFLPFRLVYQVNVYSRFNLHDRYLRSIFATDVFPHRPFWIAVDLDGTWRRTEQIGYSATDQSETSESGTKRIFRKVYTISMLAEVPQTRLADAEFYKVFRVFITGYDLDFLDELFMIAHEGVEVPTPTP